MATAGDAHAGPTLLSGANRIPIHNLDSIAAGHDVIAPTVKFKFTGPVNMISPRFAQPGGSNSAYAALDGQSAFSESKSVPHRAAILRGISRIIPQLRRRPTVTPTSSVLQSTMRRDVEDPSPENTTSSDQHPLNRDGERSALTTASQSSASVVASSSHVDSPDGVALSFLEDLDAQAFGWNRYTIPEVYVCSMLGSGKGLACWNPQPRKPHAGKEGVIPGDVGTFTAEGGFKKTFNLWDDGKAISQTVKAVSGVEYHCPERNVEHVEVSLRKGATVAQGASAKTLYKGDARTIDRFEFCSRAEKGAVLALTSPAKLEELENHYVLRSHIIRYAEAIYVHANSIRQLGDEEPLYIITGCVKSEDWGLAAFKEQMLLPDDLMKLENLTYELSEDSETMPVHWEWTDKGTSEAHVGASLVKGVKDQSLFLRGYKLDISQELRSVAKRPDPFIGPTGQDGRGSGGSGSHPGGSSSGGGGSPGRTDQTTPTGAPPNNSPSFPGGSRGEDGNHDTHERPNNVSGPGYQSPRSREHYRMPEGIRVQAFPGASRQNTCHPSDVINEYLLSITKAPFALTHDDDWRSAFEGFSFWDDLTNRQEVVEVDPEDPTICTSHGVAYLEFVPAKDVELDAHEPTLEYAEASDSGFEIQLSQVGPASLEDSHPSDLPPNFPGDMSFFSWDPPNRPKSSDGGYHVNINSPFDPPASYTDISLPPVSSPPDLRMSVPDALTNSPVSPSRTLRSHSQSPSRQDTNVSLGPNSAHKDFAGGFGANIKTAKDGSTPYSRSPELRVSHKLAERKRRKEMRDLYDELRDQLPQDRGVKSSKWELLTKAIEFVAQLKAQNQSQSSEIDALRREVETLRQGGIPPFSAPGAHPPPPPPPHHQDSYRQPNRDVE